MERVYVSRLGKQYAVRDPAKHKLIRKASWGVLKDAEFRVSERGREYVRRTHKSVLHAGILGDLIYCESPDLRYEQLRACMRDARFRTVTYNPYTHDMFMCDGSGIARASRVMFGPDGVFIVEV